MHDEKSLEHHVALDRRLVEAAKGLKVLTHLAWDPAIVQDFLEGWKKGNLRNPKVEYPAVDLSDSEIALESVMSECDMDHPVGVFLHQTANSYRLAARLVGMRGKPEFTTISKMLYGTSQDPVGKDLRSTHDAALHLLSTTDEFAASCADDEEAYTLDAEHVAERLRRGIAECFEDSPIDVVVDSSLTSKAAAGATRIRIRGGAKFSRLDVPQLLNHEALVHSATALNGRRQTNLQSLGLGAPRTTRTQEGLALFAEMITNSIDVIRLRRIAARVLAIDMALEGASFVDVFRYFIDRGHVPREAAHSTVRVFRGGDVNGGVPFTKDVVYLQGFVRVHNFLRNAIHDGNVDFAHYLFAGRLQYADVKRLRPFFESGFIDPPHHEPEWIKNRTALAAFLFYSAFTAGLHLDAVVGVDFDSDD